MDQAGGVKKRLADLVPSAKAGKTAKTGKAAKKEDKKKLKLKLGKSAKSLAYRKRKAAQLLLLLPRVEACWVKKEVLLLAAE